MILTSANYDAKQAISCFMKSGNIDGLAWFWRKSGPLQVISSSCKSQVTNISTIGNIWWRFLQLKEATIETVTSFLISKFKEMHVQGMF